MLQSQIPGSVLWLVIFLIVPNTEIARSASLQETEVTPTLAIVGGRLVDGYGGTPLEHSVILVAGNQIVAVGREGEISIPASVEQLDANGMTVLPGLWESHGHLFHVGEGNPGLFQKGLADRMPEIMQAVAETNLKGGITSLRDFCTNCAELADGWKSPLFEQQRRLRDEIESGHKIGPRIFLSGPILSQRDPEKAAPHNFSIATVAEAERATDELVRMGVDNVFAGAEIWRQPLLEAIVTTSHRAGLGVDAESRHIQALESALQAGVDRLHVVFTADSLSHYSEAELRLLIRGIKPVGQGPSANILRGPYLLSTLEMRVAYARVLENPERLDHPAWRQGLPADIYQQLRETWRDYQSIPWGIGAIERVKVIRQKLRRFIEMGGREQMVAATDVGAPLNFHPAVGRQLVHLVEVGLTPMEAIQSATLRPAQMQGVAESLGTVSVGKLADLIVVDGDPLSDIGLLGRSIRWVIKDGKLYSTDS